MSWSAGNQNSHWEDHPFWGRTPAPGPGVDRAPPGGAAPFGGFPFNSPEAWTQLFQQGGPFGGRHWGHGGPWGGGPWGGRRGHHGGPGPHHRGRGGRHGGPPGHDAGEGPSAGPSQSPPAETGVTGDPDISTPDQLNEEPDSPGTATPGPGAGPFHHAGPPPFPFPFPFGPGPHGRGPHMHRRGGGHPCRPRHHHRDEAQGPSNPPRGPPPQYEPSTNPWAQHFQNIAESFFPQAAATNTTEDQAFSPPLDLFATPAAYILHVALPGAKKSDIGVDWDPDTSQIRVAGVIHRPGDEALLASLLPTSAERRVGYFERLVKLPPPETVEQARRWRGKRPQQSRAEDDGEDAEKDDDLMDFEEEGREEIDVEGITAKMEDGILIVTVPKVERGWTEVTKVDIE